MATEGPIHKLLVIDNIDTKTDDGVTSDVSLVTPSSHVKPIVTRRELWSYYCTQHGQSAPL